ncbi:MAG TPA: hypothetical protein VGO52_17355 [Hyphomonadaceae bacterium]|nr:hypothetical protein [Hyphomonadaceae bacterium]
MIRGAAILAILTCAACTGSQQYCETRAELQHYAMMQTRGDLSFLPGGLTQDDLAGAAPEQYARLQKESVTCRSDILVSGRGGVSHICTSCSNKDPYAFRVSDSFVRRLRFKTGADARAAAVTIAYAPMRADASLILPRVAAPATGCPPEPVIP